MNRILATEFGLIVGSIISVSLLNMNIESVLSTFITINLGYFLRYYQTYKK